MPLVRIPQPFDDPAWIFELKYVAFFIFTQDVREAEVHSPITPPRLRRFDL